MEDVKDGGGEGCTMRNSKMEVEGVGKGGGLQRRSMEKDEEGQGRWRRI